VRNRGADAIPRSLVKAYFEAFHCMAHRMELAVNMATKSSGEVQRFGMFVDSLYAFYHRSPKIGLFMNFKVSLKH